jgi:hypothetical protein
VRWHSGWRLGHEQPREFHDAADDLPADDARSLKVTAIGDSVMLSAAGAPGDARDRPDRRRGRKPPVLRGRRQDPGIQGQRETETRSSFSLGTNGTINPDDFERMIEI